MPVFTESIDHLLTTGNVRLDRRALLNGLGTCVLPEASAAELARSERIDPNAWDEQAWTALHWATHTGYVSVVQALLERGVPVHEQDHQGCSAFDRLMLNHLGHDPWGEDPPYPFEVRMLRVLLPAGGRPVVLTRPPRPVNGIPQAQYMGYLKAWQQSAFQRGIQGVRLALEVDAVHPVLSTAAADASPWPARGRPRL